MTLRPGLVATLALATVTASSEAFAEPPKPSTVPPPITAPIVVVSPIGAVDDTALVVTFDELLRRVAAGNLDLAAQKQDVSIAKATVSIAKVFPNPSVTAGFSQLDPFHTGNPNQLFVGVAVPLELGGKRTSRIDVAEAFVSATESELDDALRELRASASDQFVDAVYARLVLKQKRATLESLERLVAVNKQRFNAGDVGEVVVLQSKVEADVFRAEVIGAEGDVRTADASLVQVMGAGGKPFSGKPLDVRGDLEKTADHSLDLEALLATARARRPDLAAARRRVLVADKTIDLSRANRVIDVTLGAGWQHSFGASYGGTVVSPPGDTFALNLTIPLPFSNVYKGEVHAAVASKEQSELEVRAAEVRIEADVRKAVARYKAAADRVRVFTGGTLANAIEVLDRTLYNYHRGGATMVEVLVAQHTANDVYITYYQALAEAAHALIAVDRATATSSVTF